MTAKDPSASDADVDSMPAPNPGELDALAILWREQAGEDRALQLSEVARRVTARRAEFDEPPPALSTVSTHLRNLVSKGLAEEVVVSGPASPGPARVRRRAAVRTASPVRTRGGFAPRTRSPLTAYRALHAPGEVLQGTFRALASAYPEGEELAAVRDFARALDLPAATRRRLEKLLRDEAARRG